MSSPVTPSYNPVWPTRAVDNEGLTGVQAAVTRPILLMESGEPVQTEDNKYLLQEGT